MGSGANLSVALGFVAAALAVGGSGLAASSITWRPARRGIVLEFVGIAVLLFDLAGIARGIAALLVAGGVYALLLAAPDEPAELIADSSPNVDAADPAPMVPPTDRRLRRRRARRQPIRWFDLSVVGLAIVGGLSLATSRPVLRVLAADAVVDVLILVGLASCLLGNPVRTATGLLAVVAAACVLLQLVDPQRAPFELIFLAAAQLGLAVTVAPRRAPLAVAMPPDERRWRQGLREPTGPATVAEDSD